jgi:hypothetical protein
MSLLFSISGSCVMRFFFFYSLPLCYFFYFFLHGDSGALLPFLFPLIVSLGRICISGHRQVCILTVVGVQALARRILLSTIYVLSSPPHTLACSCLLFLFYYVCLFFSPPAPSLSLDFRYPTFSSISSRFILSMAFMSERLNARCRLFQTVIPLYILFFCVLSPFFINAFSTRTGNGIFAIYLALLQLSTPFLYASIRRSISALLSNLPWDGFYFAQISYLLSFSTSFLLPSLLFSLLIILRLSFG